jgi:hypothetical protein
LVSFLTLAALRFRPSSTAAFSLPSSSGVIPVDVFLFLAGRYAHDLDCVADDAGEMLLAFWGLEASG